MTFPSRYCSYCSRGLSHDPGKKTGIYPSAELLQPGGNDCDAIAAKEQGTYEEFRESAGKAGQVVHRLMDDLDFTYPIASELYPAYQFVSKLLALAVCKNTADSLKDAKRVLKNLYDGFTEAAKQDSSGPLMQHTQQVVAGMTYQKGSLTETLQGSESSRGFFA